MKINIGKEEIELVLTSAAVELIEDRYDKPIDEIFTGDLKLRAKDVTFILWAMSNTESLLPEFKKLLSEMYTYKACVEMLTECFAGPNEKAAEKIIETPLLELPQECE